MTTDQKIVLIKTTITSTLLEAAATTGPIPRSTIYLAVGCDMQLATIVQGEMERQGWVTTTADTIRITDTGRALVASCL